MHQTSPLAGLTHGTSGLILAYASVSIPMVVGLVQGRAPLSKLLLSPALAVAVTLVAAIVITLMSPILRTLGLPGEGPLQLLFDVAESVGVGYACGRLLARRASTKALHRRGAIVSAAQPAADPRHSKRPETNVRGVLDPNSSITLAGIPVAAEDETKHFKFIGTTGTGKSTAIREMLSVALARGDRAVIADPDGGYLDCFYDASRGDVILNPFEPDAVKWHLLGEIANDYDVDQLARSLIPDNANSDRSWTQYARTLFVAVTRRMREGKVDDDAELYRMLRHASDEELKDLLSRTVAGPFLAEGNEKMFGSIRSVTASAISALDYIARQRAPAFSVRQWVRQGMARCAGGRGGVLFLPYKAGEIAALGSTISAWMRIAIFEAMDREEGDQRLWFVVDELDALGEIDGLKDALARLRKFGGRCVLGLQSISQVSGTYGDAAAHTIVENCGTTLILRCSGSEKGGTSEFASKLIGQREVMHTLRSKSRAPTAWLPSTTTSEHLNIEPAIMASEIERLPDLQGFLKVVSVPDWRSVRLTPASYPPVTRTRRSNAPPSTPTPTPTPAAPPAGLPAATAKPAPSPKPTKARAASKKRKPEPPAELAQADIRQVRAPPRAPTTGTSPDKRSEPGKRQRGQRPG